MVKKRFRAVWRHAMAGILTVAVVYLLYDCTDKWMNQAVCTFHAMIAAVFA
ncbi:MAG: hypothetical protein HFH89_02260 [Lachnospiraceae bacterium]|nr:hypothetical protein [uncultured Acetatifactor sp.]MCI8286487.1 hypothetical protein [Lachnospiraceae bacterium]